MIVSSAIACTFICIGFAGLAFVLFVKVINKFYRQYLVHWSRFDGGIGYNIVMAFSRWGAVKKLMKPDSNGEVRIVTKVVRYREVK